ncbi:hypothetical protein A7K50_08650 [Dehalobacter sp. MCB1]|nr:hypothetical protein A7K50_08650 [Dehalobacter sp. MCB1]TCX51904.1 hypothetical protein C1I36_06180 [Dehalobacter sp. 14DCB1]TCX52964.1 hypothetical protein C1I38_07860 [Dehalobacter sp. 12DCB1]
MTVLAYLPIKHNCDGISENRNCQTAKSPKKNMPSRNSTGLTPLMIAANSSPRKIGEKHKNVLWKLVVSRGRFILL